LLGTLLNFKGENAMKKIFGALAVLSAAAVAGAAPIAYDGFNYTSGSILGGDGGWVGVGSGTGRPTVVSGDLSYPGLPASVGGSVQLNNGTSANAARLSTGTITSGTVYYSFILQGSSSSSTNTSGAYFAGFDDHPTGTGTTFTTAAGLFVRQDAGDTSKLDFGISTNGSVNKNWSGAYNPSDTLLMVGSFTFGGTSTLDIFDNPTAIPASDPSMLVTTGNDTVTAQILSFYLRGNTGEPATMNVDELRIGTSWADVTAVPEPASLGLAGLGAFGAIGRRRREVRGS
jgi:PEP-CTERM motif